MEISEQVPLAAYTTFGIGGAARYFAEALSQADVLDAVRWAWERKLPLFVMGGGSNLLVPDEGFAGLVLRVALKGTKRDGAFFDVGAGESWDDFVSLAVAAECAGVECMAGIPGSVGGTPVQNVGAYGQEVSEVIESVRVLDLSDLSIRELSNAQCEFRYRESIFNTTQRGRYIVLRVGFALRRMGGPRLTYADLQKRFAPGSAPTLGEVAKAVREIRAAKGMLLVAGDPDCHSAGSFFKNPIVDSSMLQRISEAADGLQVPHWPAPAGRVKLPAAWLLERAGFVKGYGEGKVRISSKHTLALTNRGGATFAELMAMQNEIVTRVDAKFGVVLEREPVVLGSTEQRHE